MTEPELDDIAFLTGTGEAPTVRKNRDGVAMCSQKKAICVTAIVMGALVTTALIIAYAGPQNDCACAGKMPPGYYLNRFNDSEPFNPIATNGQPFPWLSLELPTSVRPIRYVLTIHPNLTNLDVKGQVTVEFHVEKETSFLVLHSQDLNITERAIIGPKGFALKINRLLEYPPRQQLYLEVKDKLRKKVNYTLNLRWYSKLVPDPEGFYVDAFDDETGARRILAATVFRPGGARKAFPCFDEAHLRAPFRISVFRDRFHIGLSNSIVHATDDVGFYMGTGLLRDDFFETPPLPPDAVAWVVSDFHRNTLEPSSTYQTVRTTPAAVVTTSRPADLALRTDKRPIKSKSILITKSLQILTPLNRTRTPQPEVEHRNSTENGTISDTGEIITAPTYTFYASKDLLQLSDFLLHTSRDVLEYLQTWLGSPYPLTKLDFVALPSLEEDITSSLGLISIKSSFLRSFVSLQTKEYHLSALKITEAIIKQFFGGITSPQSWKHNWLWQGLIKYLGRTVLLQLQPNWPMDELHLMETTMRALDVDAIEGWASLVEGSRDDGNNEDFYVDKSAAILALLHSALEEDNFRQCLGGFLRAHRFQTAEPLDLWTVCGKQMNDTKNIKEMMNLWTSHSGFPLVRLEGGDGGNFTVWQMPFAPAEFHAITDDYLLPHNLTSTTTTTTTPAPVSAKKIIPQWIFPISFVTNLNKSFSQTVWLHSNQTEIHLDPDVKWIKLNSGQNGYYRVLYTDSNWNNLIDELKKNHRAFTAKDRIGLISDVFTLCHASLMPCPITMNLITYLPNETNWGPLTTGLRHLEQWRKILKYSECFLMLAEFVREILMRSIAGLGWKNTGTDSAKLLRPEVLLASVLWEDPDAIKEAKNVLHLYLNNGTEIPTNFREVIYTGAVLSGEFTYWQYCWDRFNILLSQNEGYDERMELLRALGETKDAWLQNRLLSQVITLPAPELIQVLEAIAGTPTGGAMACRFLQAKWNDLQAKLGAGSEQFAQVITAITQFGATKFDYEELKSLVERFGYGPGMRVLNMTLRSVATNVEWVSRSQRELSSWLGNFEHMQ
ncbi:endoplasmic reticulum aminopeptidase 2 isoform X2 [Lutzomyia longipalpis]|uniref:endoplasmic reticulum aminopeptidase 2 isoform X2 n=1 Tax=Lutzomyia longipalpis TaxID=7200 RepID=UPI00248456C7|nr:endoplasmic reticulum aminopeptidase 2 isoform X2 [Lutzomyia longipalpis]